ncbi:MAG: hypothetical protein JNL11_11965 [Bdellovibrionaceae bacterium]|nr:hypothetical protein [Pseudobdellovibrionaceae bacterium]
MNTDIDLADQLKASICKIKCLSFFIETQDSDYSRSTDFDEVQRGLVLIFNGIITELAEVKDQLEN